MERSSLPLWLKIGYSAWFLVWVPLYFVAYGIENFLWLCDLCNFVVLIALWTENRLLFSSQIVGVLLVDVLWIADLAVAAVTGAHPIGGTEYMFDPTLHIGLRSFSWFHLFVPAILIWAVLRLGYDRRGVLLQTALGLIVLPSSFWAAGADRNINWVYGPFGRPQTIMDPHAFLLLSMVLYPLVIFATTHVLVGWAMKKIEDRRRQLAA